MKIHLNNKMKLFQLNILKQKDYNQLFKIMNIKINKQQMITKSKNKLMNKIKKS